MNVAKKEHQYAIVAKEAYKLIVDNNMPFEAAFGLSTERNINKIESRKKLCPKHTFLGLCQSGDLKGIKMTLKSENINYQYARLAISDWKINEELTIGEMWSKVYLHFKRAKNHQGQLDVVKGLENFLM